MEANQTNVTTNVQAQSASSSYTEDFNRFLEFYNAITDGQVLRKLAVRQSTRGLEGKALLRATLDPRPRDRFGVQLNALEEGPQLNEALDLIYKADVVHARKLYNILKPHNPLYYMRQRALDTVTLMPRHTLGIYSTEGSNKLLTAQEAFGKPNVVPRTREMIRALSAQESSPLSSVEPFKPHHITLNPGNILAYLNSALKGVMTQVTQRPTRQDLIRMPFSHFQVIPEGKYQFAYDIEAINPPVLRFSDGANTINYTPSYFVTGMDPVLAKIIDNKRYYWLNEKVSEEWRSPDPAKIYHDILSKFVYTSGTPFGQIGRLEKVQKARNNVPLEHRLEQQLTFIEVDDIGLDDPRALEFNKPRVPGLHEFASLPDMISHFDGQFKYSGSEGLFSSVRINPQSSTGIWSGSATKKNNDVNIQTLFCLAEDAMRQHSKDSSIPHAFFTGVIKNKPEVYAKDEYDTKTRNIVAFNFPATVIPQMVQTPVFKNRPIDTDQLLQFQSGMLELRSYNIAGYAPTHSFFEKLVQNMISAPDRAQFLLFMSDNLWIADKLNGEVRWLSLDGSKMESSHTQQDVTSFLDFMRRQYDWDPTTFAFYKLSVERMMVGAEGLLGSHTYYIDQLTSGYPETAGVNCIKMARIVKYILLLWNAINHDFKHDEVQVVLEHYQRVGGSLPQKGKTLYELWLTGHLKPAFSSEGVTMEQTIQNKTVLATLEDDISPLDFLGYDITRRGTGELDPDLGRVFPVLEKQRLLKAIVFNKTVQKTKNLDSSDKNMLQACVGISKTTSLLIAGGWAHHDIREDLQAMFYNYQSHASDIDQNLLAAAIVNDLDELGFSEELLQLSATMPNMDAIARIFLDEQDYQHVRQVLDEFLRSEEAQNMTQLEVDFLVERPADKSLGIQLFPVGERFAYAEAGDYSSYPDVEPPQPLTGQELTTALNRAEKHLIRGSNYVFDVSENFYVHHLNAAVDGIKASIITDLSKILKAAFSEEPLALPDLIKFIEQNIGSERAITIGKQVAQYIEMEEGVSTLKERLRESLRNRNPHGTKPADSLEDYRMVIVKSSRLDTDGPTILQQTMPYTPAQINDAQQIENGLAQMAALYAKAASLMREELVHTAKEWIKSEVFQFLLRDVLVMPQSFKEWTSQHMITMVSVQVNSLSAFQLCTEAYFTKPKAPFTLTRIEVVTKETTHKLMLPLNSSIKRSALSVALANATHLPGSVRKTPEFKAAIQNIYLNVHKDFTFVLSIRTNTVKRLRAITNPISVYPAREAVEQLRHVAVIHQTVKGMYFGYLSVLYQARLINEMPLNLSHDQMADAVASVRRTLHASKVGVSQTLTLVKQALFGTSTSVSATMVALLEALPKVRDANGKAGFMQAVLRPQEIYNSAVALQRLTGVQDFSSLLYLMSLVTCQKPKDPDLLDLRSNIQRWAIYPKTGQRGKSGPIAIKAAFEDIWKSPVEQRLHALTKFLLMTYTIFPMGAGDVGLGSNQDAATSLLQTQFVRRNPYRYFAEMLGATQSDTDLETTRLSEALSKSDQWADVFAMLRKSNPADNVQKSRLTIQEVAQAIEAQKDAL